MPQLRPSTELRSFFILTLSNVVVSAWIAGPPPAATAAMDQSENTFIALSGQRAPLLGAQAVQQLRIKHEQLFARLGNTRPLADAPTAAPPQVRATTPSSPMRCQGKPSTRASSWAHSSVTMKFYQTRTRKSSNHFRQSDPKSGREWLHQPFS